MRDLQIGDLVQIKYDLNVNQVYGGVTWRDCFVPFEGNVVTITDIKNKQTLLFKEISYSLSTEMVIYVPIHSEFQNKINYFRCILRCDVTIPTVIKVITLNNMNDIQTGLDIKGKTKQVLSRMNGLYNTIQQYKQQVIDYIDTKDKQSFSSYRVYNFTLREDITYNPNKIYL